MNKLPFKEGDILFNVTSKNFVYVYKVKFETSTKYAIDNNVITYDFMVIGHPNEVLSSTQPLEYISLYMTRYGNIDSIDMNLEDLKKI